MSLSPSTELENDRTATSDVHHEADAETQKWSRRKTLLFVVCTSLLLWATNSSFWVLCIVPLGIVRYVGAFLGV